MSCPNDRCGYVLTIDDTSYERLTLLQRAYGPFEDVCCWRQTWKDKDRCVWHARSDDKTVEELKKARSDFPERLDNIFLRGLRINDIISFEGCSIHHSTFENCYFEHTNFNYISGSNVTFDNCEMSRGNFKGCSMSGEFPNSNMQIMNFYNSKLHNCDFSEALIHGDFRFSDISDSDLSQGEISLSNFTGSRIISTNFSHSMISGWYAHFIEASHNDFSNCDIYNLEAYYSRMRETNFEQSKFYNCNLISVDLEGSNFINVSFTGCNMQSSDLFGSLFQNVQLDRSTNFGDHYETQNRPSIDVEKFIEMNDLWESNYYNRGGEDKEELIEKRVWTLQILENILDQNSISTDARLYYIDRKESQRELCSLSGKWTNPRWYLMTGSKYIMGYGEKPRYVIIWSLISIFGFAAIYAGVGGVEGAQIKPPLFGIDLGVVKISPPELVMEYLTNLYFSSMTFSNLGYGDLEPATWGVRFFATIQSIIGALLMALLVFVLGRRSTW